MEEPFDAISKQIWLDSIAWDTHFDRQMTLNTALDDTSMNDASNNVWPSTIACESYLYE